MMAFCGGDALKKEGIYKPSDLIKFNWDAPNIAPITEDEVDELQAEMAAINAQNAKSSEE
jgi:hypothetical protein